MLVVKLGHGTYYGKHGARGLKAMNCRAVQSGIQFLQSRARKHCYRNGYYMPKSSRCYLRSCKQSRKRSKMLSTMLVSPQKGMVFSGDISLSELWAGPAYSNSPPPSLVPIPKLSVEPKHEVVEHSRSAPSTSIGESCSQTNDISLCNATATLRRVLNLEILDD